VNAAERDAIVAGLVAYNERHGFPGPWRDLDFVLEQLVAVSKKARPEFQGPTETHAGASGSCRELDWDPPR
jgi:hypothetical protein